jgi:hypothetical protein
VAITMPAARCTVPDAYAFGDRPGGLSAAGRECRAQLRAHLDRGGLRRAWLRGREKVQKRYLVHVAGYNLGLLNASAARRRNTEGTDPAASAYCGRSIPISACW